MNHIFATSDWFLHCKTFDSFNLLSLQFMNLFTMIALLVMTFFSSCMSSIDMSQFWCFHCCFTSYLSQNYVCFCIDWRSTTLIKKNAIFHTVVRGRCFLGLEKREFGKFHCMCGFWFFYVHGHFVYCYLNYSTCIICMCINYL